MFENRQKKSKQNDSLQTFTFENYPIRGWVIRLNSTYRSIISQRPYPDIFRQLLAESIVSSLVISEMCVESGILTLSYEGSNGINLISVRCTHKNEIRAILQADKAIKNNKELKKLLSCGSLSVSYHPTQKGDPFSNDIPLMSHSITDSMSQFLENDQRLPTLFKLVLTPHSVVGMCLQYVQNSMNDGTCLAYEHVLRLAKKIPDSELLKSSNHILLKKAFPQDEINLDRAKPIRFKCDCSSSKMQVAILSMGECKVENIIANKESVDVTCEFCNNLYVFDRIDVYQIFKMGRSGGLSDAMH